MRFRFVHAADLGLDTPFHGIRRVEAHVGSALLDASLQAFDALVQLAIEREAAFVLLAGDVYEGPSRGIRAQLAFRRGLERLSRAGIQTFVVLGEADPVDTGWSAIRAWPAEVTVFGSDQVDQVTVHRDGQAIAAVHGISYGHRAQPDSLVPGFQRGDGHGIHIGLLHTALDAEGGATLAPASLDDLRAAGMDYWALGHGGRREVLGEGEPWVVYPGSPQGRSPLTQQGPQGAMVVEVDGGTIGAPEFVALDRVRLETVAVDVGPLADLAQIAAVLQETGRQRAAEADGRSLVLTAELTGSGPVVAELRRAGAARTILDRLREEAAGGTPFVWWERVADGTSSGLDTEALRLRADLPGELLEAADALQNEPERLRAFADHHLGELHARDELREARNGHDGDGPGGRPDWPRVLDLALDLLVDDR